MDRPPGVAHHQQAPPAGGLTLGDGGSVSLASDDAAPARLALGGDVTLSHASGTINIASTGNALQPGIVDEPHVPGNFVGAGNLEPLPFFQRAHEFGRFQQAVVRTGVEPCVASAHDLNIQFALLQVVTVHVRDFQFAARGRF